MVSTMKPRNKISNLSTLLVLASLGLATIGGLPSAAQTADVEPDETPTAEQPTADEAEASPAANVQRLPVQQKKEATRGGDVFRPTEEISEDFAVSFPSDI